nr:PREDICTED: uncharacterized protein LOC106490336 [Apteryx mantelli mantelli]
MTRGLKTLFPRSAPAVCCFAYFCIRETAEASWPPPPGRGFQGRSGTREESVLYVALGLSGGSRGVSTRRGEGCPCGSGERPGLWAPQGKTRSGACPGRELLLFGLHAGNTAASSCCFFCVSLDCYQCKMRNDSISAASTSDVQDRLSALELRVQQQEDEITVLKAALADVLRRLAISEDHVASVRKSAPSKSQPSLREAISMSCITNGSTGSRKTSHSSSVSVARKETLSSAAKSCHFRNTKAWAQERTVNNR